MAQAANWYANFLVNAFHGQFDINREPTNMALLGSGYTPNFSADSHWADISANEITGTGYTAGGVTLTSVTATLTAANSWTVTWAATTTYTYGQVVIPPTPNGFLYRCVAAGATGGTAPSFPTVVGETVTDGSVTWACMGADILVFTSNLAQWITATFTASYAVIYTPGSGTYNFEPLIVLETFAAPQSPSAQNFQVIPDPVLGWGYWSPPS